MSQLPAQQPVTPPETPARPPSLALYGALTALSVALIVLAFLLGTGNWSSLLLNLATELLGAVIILILVERRLRPQDVVLLQSATTSLRLRLLLLTSRQARQLVAYARMLQTRLASVAIAPVYVERPEIEDDARAGAKHGILILGRFGEGKTTLLHHIAEKEANALLRDPKRAKVPVVLPLRTVSAGDVDEHVFGEMRRYCSLSAKTYRAVADDRLLCLFDGLDECADAHRLASDIAAFKSRHPRVEVLVTARANLPMSVRERLDLDVMEMPPLS
ncbi:MAG TPA: NACHT domain-containing protein, partial [Thermoanaerobaculia bacterium]|nr:NACHT domain-containing protein [Thermoanaerobaculia bacterium]